MDNVKGVWRTVRGRRVFIAEGQDLYTAMEKSGKFKNLGKRGTYQVAKNTRKYDLQETDAEFQDNAKKVYRQLKKNDYERYRADMANQANIFKEDAEANKGYVPKHNKREAQRMNKKMYKAQDEKIRKNAERDYLNGKISSNDLDAYRDKLDVAQDKLGNFRYLKSVEKGETKGFTGYERQALAERRKELEDRKAKVSAYKAKKGITTNSTSDDDSLYDSKNSSKAYSSYLKKAKELDETVGSWTGKEYTNDEFMEHLTDANWHTERKMIEDAKLTNNQLAYVKDNTRLSMWGSELDKKSTEDLIAKAKKINSFTQKSTGDNLSRSKSMTPKERARSIDSANADYSKMTRQQLAEVIVDDQISRGVVKAESRNIQIKGRLKGIGSAKPMSKKELLDAVNAIKNKK